MKRAPSVGTTSRWTRVRHALRRQRAAIAIVGGFVVLIAGMVGYNAYELNTERQTPLVVSVTERQRALVERYIKDVLLQANGYQADPAHDMAVLSQAADSLIHGGQVVTPTGAYSDLITIPGATDPVVLAKLRHERDLIQELGVKGAGVLVEGWADPAHGRGADHLHALCRHRRPGDGARVHPRRGRQLVPGRNPAADLPPHSGRGVPRGATPSDVVVSQSPAPGSPTSSGQSVTLTVRRRRSA